MENPLTFTVEQAAKLHGVSRETIRTWSIEFAEYLSPTANPSSGRQRLYTEDDMRVISLIAELKGQGQVYADIHAALKIGQRGAAPEVLPDELTLMINTETERKMMLQIDQMERQIDRLSQEINRLKDIEKEVTRYQVREEMLREQIERTEQRAHQLELELKQALQNLGRAQGELNSERKHPPQN